MTANMLDQTMSIEIPPFRPSDHLLGIVQGIIASRVNSRIVLAGQGEIIVLPKAGSYYTNAQNMARFCQAPAAQFETTPLGNSSLSYPIESARNIKELLWQAAFHVSQGRLPEGCTKYDVVQFRHWPNLTRLPITPHAAQICALLTRTPTTIMLVRRILDIPREEVFQIYSAAYCAGITTKIQKTPEQSQAEADIANTPPPAPHGLMRSLFAKILGL
ncbi:MAG: hypothetical protein PHI11_07925 [Gallionella sp.]|nr:hypothetical protein [Gallionella sp.]